MNKKTQPLIIIGPPRSGTTLLGSIFEAHPDVLFVGEPNFVWRYGNASSKTDLLTKQNYTEKIGDYIRNWFEKKLHHSKKKYLVEKTPANCMRIPFLLEVYPDAKYIILTRNPIDTIESVKKEMSFSKHKKKQGIRKNNKSILTIKLEKISQIHWSEWLYYIPEFYSSLLQLFKIKKTHKAWGPKFPGIYDLQEHMGSVEIAAIQWSWCIGMILKDKHLIPNENLYELKYEDLLNDSDMQIKNLFDFAGISIPELDSSLIKPQSSKKETSLTPDELQVMDFYVADLAKKLHYLDR